MQTGVHRKDAKNNAADGIRRDSSKLEKDGHPGEMTSDTRVPPSARGGIIKGQGQKNEQKHTTITIGSGSATQSQYNRSTTMMGLPPSTQAKKPVFLTKKQREKLREEQRQKLERDMIQHEQQVSSTNQAAATESSLHPHQKSHLTDKEIQEIKQSYMAPHKSTSSTTKNERRHSKRIIEDWDVNDDTSTARDGNPLFQRAPRGTPLFGRGKRGGESLKDDMLLTDPSTSKPWFKKSLHEMTKRDWRIFKEEFEIRTRGKGVPNPIRYWDEAPVPPTLQMAIREARYKRPTPIQMQCVPLAFSHRDILGVAETGSGKTAAFVIPMLSQIAQLPRLSPQEASKGPYALVLAPTRELVQQIASEVKKLAKHTDVRVMFVIGGESIQDQQLELNQGVEILIATPGRLVDLLQNRYVALSQCRYMVLDEADRMCSMNYEDDLLHILKCMPEDKQLGTAKERGRQTVMFSATMPSSVEKLAHEYLKDRILVSIGEMGRINENIDLITLWMDESDKKKQLKNVLHRARPPVIIFCNERKAVDAVSQYLQNLKFNVVGIHGGKPQSMRESIIDGFRTGYYDYLVATDLAGRGIDIEGITLVLNYDIPDDISKFKHRVGRTGRAGAKGKAISFITARDTKIMYDLKRLLRASGAHIPQELSIADASRTTEQVQRNAQRKERS